MQGFNLCTFEPLGTALDKLGLDSLPLAIVNKIS